MLKIHLPRDRVCILNAFELARVRQQAPEQKTMSPHEAGRKLDRGCMGLRSSKGP